MSIGLASLSLLFHQLHFPLKMMSKKVILGTPMLLGAVAVKSAREPTSEPLKPTTTVEDDLSQYQCKPSELPLYTPLHTLKPLKSHHTTSRDSKIRQTIESGVRAVRVEITSGYNAVVQQKQQITDFISTGIAHSQSTIDYLNQPDNTLPRVGAIAIGGVSGLILAVRGGFFKKIIYTGIGAGGIASLCYPKEAEKFAQQGLLETKKGVSIAYNFVKGVKPGEEAAEEPISNFPTSLAALKDMAYDLAGSAKDAVFSSKK